MLRSSAAQFSTWTSIFFLWKKNFYVFLIIFVNTSFWSWKSAVDPCSYVCVRYDLWAQDINLFAEITLQHRRTVICEAWMRRVRGKILKICFVDHIWAFGECTTIAKQGVFDTKPSVVSWCWPPSGVRMSADRWQLLRAAAAALSGNKNNQLD